MNARFSQAIHKGLSGAAGQPRLSGVTAAASAGVFGTGAAWPDITVASIMAMLGLISAREVIGRARQELQNPEKQHA